MSIQRVCDIFFSEVISTSYDVSVFASGYESRCVAIPKQLKTRTANPIVLGFRDLANTDARQIHDKYFQKEFGVTPICVPAGDDFSIQSALNNFLQKKGPIKRILVDCSSMSRLWYTGILNWARYSNPARETMIDLVYALGLYEQNDTPMVIENVLSIPGCEGGCLPSKPSIAVFGLGFNGWASLCVLELLETDTVFALIASPGSSPGYPDIVKQLNKDFLAEPRINKVLELPLRSVESCYRYLCELVAPYRGESSVTLVPMGPKPHVLASILVAMRFPDITCLRVSAKRAKPEHVSPTGEIIAVRTIIRNDTYGTPKK